MLKRNKDLDVLSQAARIVVTVLQKLVKKIEPGISTADLDELAQMYLKPFKAKPAFLVLAPVGSSPLSMTSMLSFVSKECNL